ncbi:hypothetical protein [Diaphorobacter aerolatus]|uniref:hypothetical protein n=1 Tax=Diaphorobacter aerolatus TaxID=1288495 RepID=UPI00384F4CE4
MKISLRTRDQRVALAKARDLAIAAHRHFDYALMDMTAKPHRHQLTACAVSGRTLLQFIPSPSPGATLV